MYIRRVNKTNEWGGRKWLTDLEVDSYHEISDFMISANTPLVFQPSRTVTLLPTNDQIDHIFTPSTKPTNRKRKKHK